MMKILLLSSLCLFPFTTFSSCSILFIILTVLAFFPIFSLDFFLLYPNFAWDILSFVLISLSIFITILMILSSISNKAVLKYKSLFLSATLTLLVTLIYTFSVSNMILFYILFETSLIPIFMIILGWGNQPERLQAGMYMLMYTVSLSLPLLVMLSLWAYFNNSSSILLLNLHNISNFLSYITALTLLLAFLVKLPIYMLHLWLPKAHVEAPVAGSMILAAVLLKLGGYGILRISSKSYSMLYNLSPALITWSLMGGVMVSFICLFQTDIKSLIALSSVAHMALVLSGLMTFSSWGNNSALIIMLGHGFCSSGLFSMANMVYERMNSRSLFILKGLQTIMPSFYIMWFLLCTSNMSAPPSLNLLGEIMGISSVHSWVYSTTPLLMTLVFMSASYSLLLFSQTQHGKASSLLKPTLNTSIREWMILIFHWAPLNFMILAPWLIQMFM